MCNVFYSTFNKESHNRDVVCEKVFILCQYRHSITPTYVHSFSYTYMYTVVHTYTYMKHILQYNKIVCWVYFCTFISVLFKLSLLKCRTYCAIPRLLLDECLNVHTCIFKPTLCIRLNVFSTCFCLLCCITSVVTSCCNYFILAINPSFSSLKD